MEDMVVEPPFWGVVFESFGSMFNLLGDDLPPIAGQGTCIALPGPAIGDGIPP
jgi:hypothetical protein